MTVGIFIGSLLGTMALGIPIAFALLATGVAAPCSTSSPASAA